MFTKTGQMEPSTNPSAAVPQRKRRRPALACEQCRRRKVKCDRNSPCDQCTKTKSEACTYVLDDRTSPHIRMRSAGLPHALSSRSASPTIGSESSTYTDMLSTISAFDPRVGQIPTTNVSSSFAEGSARERGVDLTFGLEQSLTDRITSLEHKFSHAASSQSSEPILVSPSRQDPGTPTTPPLRGVFSKTRFFGQSHWMNNSQQVSYYCPLFRV